MELHVDLNRSIYNACPQNCPSLKLLVTSAYTKGKIYFPESNGLIMNITTYLRQYKYAEVTGVEVMSRTSKE